MRIEVYNILEDAWYKAEPPHYIKTDTVEKYIYEVLMRIGRDSIYRYVFKNGEAISARSY